MSTIKRRALLVAYNDLNNSGVPNVIYQVVKVIWPFFDIDIIVFSDDKYYFKKLEQEGINVQLIKLDAKIPSGKIKKLKYHLFDYPKKMYKRCKEIMSNNKYDVIHSFRENYSWPFLKAAKKAGITTRVIHSNIDGKKKKTFGFKLIDYINKEKTIKYATKLIGVSSKCCDSVFGKNKGEIIHNTFNEGKFNSGNPNNSPRNHMVLSQIGTYNDNKNQLFSLEVAKQLKEKGANFELWLVGKESEKGYLSKIKNGICNFGLEKQVKIVNETNKIEDIYSATTFVLIPSKTEGASIVAIESQACGISVFASASISPDMNVGGITFFDPKATATVWAKTILDTFLLNKNTRKKMDLSAFSNKVFEQKIKNIYTIS